jgi:type II restriction enzyme
LAEFELLARQLIQRWKEDPRDVPELVSMGRAHQEFSLDQAWSGSSGCRDRSRSVWRGLSRFFSGDGRSFSRRAEADIQGADHAFLWKPKLRIPDIYENPANQRAFGRLLDHCACCDTAEEIIAGIHTIDRLNIKGLGPAVANLLYFLHPILVPPFNTAIVNGYNKLTGGKVKLGSWQHFLAMRSGVLDLNERFRDLLSNDLGAIGGLLFDIGSAAIPRPRATRKTRLWDPGRRASSKPGRSANPQQSAAKAGRE